MHASYMAIPRPRCEPELPNGVSSRRGARTVKPRSCENVETRLSRRLGPFMLPHVSRVIGREDRETSPGPEFGGVPRFQGGSESRALGHPTFSVE